MGLIGLSHNQVQNEKPTKVSVGTKIICKIPTITTTKGKVYSVRGHFCYLNRKSFDNDHWWEWDEFYTLKMIMDIR